MSGPAFGNLDFPVIGVAGISATFVDGGSLF